MWWEGLSLYLTCYKPWFSVLQVLMHCTPSSNPSIHPLLFSHPLVIHRSTYLPSNPQNLPTASDELCSLLSCEGLCAEQTLLHPEDNEDLSPLPVTSDFYSVWNLLSVLAIHLVLPRSASELFPLNQKKIFLWNTMLLQHPYISSETLILSIEKNVPSTCSCLLDPAPGK